MNEKMPNPPVRYSLDFRIFPDLFYHNPAPFLTAILQQGEDLFNNIFNDYYKPANESFLSANPVEFKKEDFLIRQLIVSPDQFILVVHLPGEHDSSLVWCRAYMFAYDIKKDHTDARVQFFTVEESNAGTVALCSVHADGRRSNYGPCGGDSIDVSANKVASIFFGDKNEEICTVTI